MKFSKYFLGCTCALAMLFSFSGFAEEFPAKVPGNDFWYTLKMAQNAYDANDYGSALALAEEAKEKKQKVSDWEHSVLDHAQKSSYIRKAGDYLVELIPALEEKEYKDALYIVNRNIREYGSDKFGGKFSLLRDWVSKDYLYPEADFLIGKVYKLEGETELASEYLMKAYENKDRLDISEVKYDILYELAALADYKDDGSDYEQKLMAVLADDKFYKDKGFMSALDRIVKLDTDESVEKFFLLYRSTNDISIRALEELCDYYNRIGQTKKALQCACLGSIASVTKIEEILKDRLIGYSYTTFQDMLSKASSYSDIIDWGNTNKIWKLFYNLASTARKCEYTVFANTLFKMLAAYQPEPYWQSRAKAEVIY